MTNWKFLKKKKEFVKVNASVWKRNQNVTKHQHPENTGEKIKLYEIWGNLYI